MIARVGQREKGRAPDRRGNRFPARDGRACRDLCQDVDETFNLWLFLVIRGDFREVREAARHPKEVEGRGRDREARRGGEAVAVAFLYVVMCVSAQFTRTFRLLPM